MESKHSEKLMEPTFSDGGSEPRTLTKEQYAKLWAEVAKKHLLPSTDLAKKGEAGRDDQLKTKGVAKGGPSGNN